MCVRDVYERDEERIAAFITPEHARKLKADAWRHVRRINPTIARRVWRAARHRHSGTDAKRQSVARAALVSKAERTQEVGMARENRSARELRIPQNTPSEESALEA